mmetsp:Transcript_22686/g.59202  ORF Transcript_22686/g.59202 Transcript_22686/m.59202 type:complete len:224 (-) Transcript_22686:3-674(-)
MDGASVVLLAPNPVAVEGGGASGVGRAPGADRWLRGWQASHRVTNEPPKHVDSRLNGHVKVDERHIVAASLHLHETLTPVDHGRDLREEQPGEGEAVLEGPAPTDGASPCHANTRLAAHLPGTHFAAVRAPRDIEKFSSRPQRGRSLAEPASFGSASSWVTSTPWSDVCGGRQSVSRWLLAAPAYKWRTAIDFSKRPLDDLRRLQVGVDATRLTAMGGGHRGT